MLKSESNYYYNFENSYERFMKKHLQHYGYYKGNKLILRELETYEKTHGYPQSDDSGTESENAVRSNQKLEESVSLKTTQIIYDYFEDGSYIRKLKAPHNYILNLQQTPRWPIEMQVIPERIHHITTLPQNRELIYIPSNSEIKPQPRGEECGRLIFEYNTYSGPYFTKSKMISKENQNLRPVTVGLESNSDETLCFESRFESGNLEKVYQISPFEYELYLRPDMYTTKHTQWYYFRVSNTRANKTYRFTIVNFYKAESLYNEGLKPLFYSEKDARLDKGWRRWGQNITYYKNNLKYETKKGEHNYYSLTWNCKFPHDNDTVYFSHCYPYTYSNLMKYIDTVSKDPVKSKICRIKLLTKTLAENISILLTITNSSTPEEERKYQKKIILITGRVHPGETNASWMVEGVLDFLLSDKPDAILLRDMFIFKIVPMLNPDGVIVGNYRCSLTGRDLNRNYKSQLKEYYPIICSIKILIEKLMKDHEILFYCDFHGHSRKQNIFMYGCNDQKNENEFLLERAFPFLLGKNASDKFDYKSCKFKMQKSKNGTSRIVFRNYGISHSFTIEASFCGTNLIPIVSNEKIPQFYHFNTDDLKMMGEAFCYSLLDFCDPDQSQMNLILTEIKEEMTNKYTKKLQTKGISVDPNKISSINALDLDTDEGSSGDDDDGSDSSDSNGLPTHFEFIEEIRVKKKVKRKENKECKNNVKEAYENRSYMGVRCLTCIHLTNNHSTPTKLSVEPKPKIVHFSEIKTKKFKTPSPKFERNINEEKEKTLILPKCVTNNSTKKISPNLLDDTTKLTFQEIGASKIELCYSGVPRHKSENCTEGLCSFHFTESIKEKKFKNNSNFQLWKPMVNLNEQVVLSRPHKLQNLNRPKSGLPTNTFQIISFTSLPTEPNCKQRPDHHKSINPNKRVQSILINKKNSTSIEENNKQSDKY